MNKNPTSEPKRRRPILQCEQNYSTKIILLA